MTHCKIMLPIILSLFDGGAAAGGAAGAASAPGGADGAGNQGETQKAGPAVTQRGKSGEYANVVFGKEAPAAASQQGNEAGSGEGGQKAQPHDAGAGEKIREELHREFLDLVNTKYKDAYTAETQKIINRRFGEEKARETQLSEQQPIIDALMQHYGIADGDISKLRTAFDGDDAMSGVLFAEEADALGMSVEQYRAYRQIQMENEALRRREEERRGRENAQRQYDDWMQQAAEMVGTPEAPGDYPGFDLRSEVESNPRFLSMLEAGVPLRNAYEVAHLSEILAGTARAVSAETEKRVTDHIRAKGNRPAENGTSSQTGIIRKSDPSKFTKAERQEIARRVARGEKIFL